MNKSIPKMIKANFNNELLKNLRKQIGYSHEAMSKALGYKSPHGYFYLEKGRSRVSAEQLYKISKLFNIPMEEFFTHEENA